MQATEIYEIGKKAYNGDQEAQRQWFNKLYKIAVNAGKPYGVLPSLILGKAVCESGWGTDLYEEQNLEPRFNLKLQRKAQKHNNLMGMNAFDLNCKYLNNLPKTAWSKYKSIFLDYGPHIHNGQYVMTPGEPWKSFINIEDCFEDWAANMRFQASYHKKQWNNNLKDQLLAIQSYTPEGAAAATLGLHFEWQDKIIQLYNKFELWKYDKEVFMPVKMTTANLDYHVKQAYEYAHKFCRYAPCLGMPPMQDGQADCVGLIFRALYTMGYVNKGHNINQIGELCTAAGLVKTTDIKDVERHHCVVCFQDNNVLGSANVGHVYYSLGTGKINGKINKYDLGSDQRIKASQPFTDVDVNQWVGKRTFLCAYYVQQKEEKTYKTALPKYKTKSWTKGQIKKQVGLYEGPGTAWKKITTLQIGTLVDFGPKITNTGGKDWRRVKTNKYDGYIYGSSVGGITPFVAYSAKIIKLDKNDYAALRIGPGTNFEKIDELKSGTQVIVRDSVIYNNIKWYYVIVNKTKKKGYISATLITN